MVCIHSPFSDIDTTGPLAVGKEHGLGLLSGAYQDFTDEGLWWLCHEGRYDGGDVVRLQFLFGILTGSGASAGVVAEVRIDRARSHNTDANVVLAQFLGHRVCKAIQAPF